MGKHRFGPVHTVDSLAHVIPQRVRLTDGPYVAGPQDCAILKEWIGLHLNPSLLRDFC